MYVCDALHDLLPFVQFKKREKQPWRSVTLVKLHVCSKLHGAFHVFYTVQMVPNRATHYI